MNIIKDIIIFIIIVKMSKKIVFDSGPLLIYLEAWSMLYVNGVDNLYKLETVAHRSQILELRQYYIPNINVWWQLTLFFG